MILKFDWKCVSTSKRFCSGSAKNKYGDGSWYTGCSSHFVRLAKHLAALRARCHLNFCRKPDVLRPGSVRLQSSTVTRKRPRMTTSTPPFPPTTRAYSPDRHYCCICIRVIYHVYEVPGTNNITLLHLRMLSRKLLGRRPRASLDLSLLLGHRRDGRPRVSPLERCPSRTPGSGSYREALCGSTLHPPHFTSSTSLPFEASG